VSVSDKCRLYDDRETVQIYFVYGQVKNLQWSNVFFFWSMNVKQD